MTSTAVRTALLPRTSTVLLRAALSRPQLQQPSCTTGAVRVLLSGDRIHRWTATTAKAFQTTTATTTTTAEAAAAATAKTSPQIATIRPIPSATTTAAATTTTTSRAETAVSVSRLLWPRRRNVYDQSSEDAGGSQPVSSVITSHHHLAPAHRAASAPPNVNPLTSRAFCFHRLLPAGTSVGFSSTMSARQCSSMAGAKECIDFLTANVKLEDSAAAADYDCVVIIGASLNEATLGKASGFTAALQAAKTADAAFEKQVTLLSVNGTRVVYSPTGPFNRDQDDARVFYDAALKGVKRALSAGAKKPLVCLPVGPLDTFDVFSIGAASVLGAFEAVYVPLEIREDVPDKRRKVQRLGFVNFAGDASKLRYLLAVESGRIACRDIGGSDPERMAPPKVEEYVATLFANTPVSVKVVANREQLEANYPCLAAVDRCASHVKRHSARMILLEYSDGTADEVLAFVGKGVTYDTGGADIKAGGIMAGMHRDKCGAAFVAGFFQTLVAAKPKNLRVLGALCMVRNSVGSDSYVADELLTSRAGVRIRVGNTDAEGRMAMVDALAEMKERVLESGEHAKAHLFTVATLTGHACLAVGEPYSITVDNGPAKAKKASTSLQSAGDAVGDMFEISTLRREDYSMIEGKSEYEDVLQCNNLASSRTPRGHQFPAAFLIRVAGLDKHGRDSAKPIAYSHLDIAAASGPFPGIPSGSPVPAMAQKYIYPRLF